MMNNLCQALENLVGRDCTITTDAGTFEGTLASVDKHLVILCSDTGVTYIATDDIVAVSTGRNGDRDRHGKDGRCPTP